jgi:hypothetical protein
LIEAVAADDAITNFNAQRVLLRFVLSWWVSQLVVPGEGKRIVVISIIRIPVPVSRKTDNVRSLFETAITNQLGVQSTFNALEHELQKLTIQQWTDAIFNFTGIDGDRSRLSRLRGDISPDYADYRDYSQNVRARDLILALCF